MGAIGGAIGYGGAKIASALIKPSQQQSPESEPAKKQDALNVDKAAAPSPETPDAPAPVSDGESPVLYRADTRLPSEIFDLGFEPHGKNMNLMDHVSGSDTSGYVATTKSPGFAAGWIGEDSYVYSIQNSGKGVDVNATLGSRSPIPHQQEVAVPGGIPSSGIIGAQRVLPGNKLGPMIPNPNFKMTKGFL